VEKSRKKTAVFSAKKRENRIKRCTFFKPYAKVRVVIEERYFARSEICEFFLFSDFGNFRNRETIFYSRLDWARRRT
jgi:hypothetical protein